ncbi:DEAD/DEAH box helicase [Sutcliffiella halmapala]|uniref:DEAD/DEAH box helicase n=1 Tax=Sutcliffiella halmapala TaxID=79882 RepID=UPI000995003D|nr:DEAD/DEAH box helicase [Sutcliffiella halmapala]
MNIKLNQKIIKELCGTVSFKRGDSFYRANKVRMEQYDADCCEATVIGSEDFQVVIVKDSDEGFRTQCSCPKLASIKQECQHIAAVLLTIYEHQQQGTVSYGTSVSLSATSTNQELTEGLFTLFKDQPRAKSSVQQLHFEKREVLHTEFICTPVSIDKEENLFGIEVKINQINVQHIREFLEQVNEGKSSMLSQFFKYDPTIHCFSHEANAVIQQLLHVIHDEKLYVNEQWRSTDYDNNLLLIPPSSWERLFPILARTSSIKLVYNGNRYEGLRVAKEPLSLVFDFIEADRKGYQLNIKGLQQMVLMTAYNTVLTEGKLVNLKKDDCIRLFELKQMLEQSGTNQISIPQEQLDYFLGKVVPELRKLGEVHLPSAISKEFANTALTAKLYLDRVKNRLLAGLEFHYENIMINPLEDREYLGRVPLIRDMEKEGEILQLIEESGFATTDEGYYLHNEELEYDFLYHIVPKLQKLLQIYATTAVRNRIFKEKARPQIRVRVKKERTNWLEFKFEMDGIPDKQIQGILLALEEKRKFYRLKNGSLLSLETREFEEINRFLHALPVQNEDLESGLNVPIVQGLALLDSVRDQEVFTIEESFRQFLEEIRNPSSLEYEVPIQLAHILRDYQIQGFKWLKTLASYGFGGILADDMGLGKTLQSITYIQSELTTIRKKKLPILIVCPSSVTYNWLSELMKFTPEIEAVVMDGNKSERGKLQKVITDMDVIITSYPLLRKDIKWFETETFHTVFFDEAQAFKNPVTQTARAVKRIQADFRFALTGTPVENSLEELWSIFHVVFPELFKGIKEYSNLSRKAIARRIRPFLLRRLKEDVLLELPEKNETMEYVELLPEQKQLYAAYLAKLRHDTLKHLDKDTLRKNRIKILAGLTRLRQICCHPTLFVDGYKGSSAKFDMLLQIVKESTLSGRRVLIFSQFTKMLALIGRELAFQGLPFFYLDGQTPSEERVESCHRFNAGERDFFLISLKAGGTGLNLTGADTVILYDIWWNPAVEEQAADRAHRIGQTNEVQVIKLVAKGTIEEKMNELQEKKRRLIEEIIDAEEKPTSTLTEEDIREILMI